jgi:hypothetical protein
MNLVSCRYNPSHKMKITRLLVHENNCPDRRNVSLMVCPYNPLHKLSPEKYENHKSECPYRPKVDQSSEDLLCKFLEEKKKKEFEALSSMSIIEEKKEKKKEQKMLMQMTSEIEEDQSDLPENVIINDINSKFYENFDDIDDINKLSFQHADFDEQITLSCNVSKISRNDEAYFKK